MTRAVLFGAGRMAAAIARTSSQDSDLEIAAVVSRSAPGREFPFPCLATLHGIESKPDVLIDFSLPEGTLTAADWCRKSGVALLSGVTGLPESTHRALAETAEHVAVLWSPNLSIGLNIVAELCAQAAGMAPPGSTVHIEDVHHQWKKDAPSGTALLLGDAVQSGWKHGQADVAYASRREGEVIGAHKVSFELEGERFELAHEALDRAIFARGAVAAAHWLARQRSGLYTAADWLAG